MGVLDFLSDLSKASKKDELGLGGMRSLLGTRGAAPKGKRGDEMMSRTSSDSLPGYFNPETREYVPWYVDLFDGGGLNESEGLLSDAQKVTTAVDMLNTNGAPVQRAGQMAPGLGSQLSDMEMANRNRAAQMAPGLGSQLSDMEMANRNLASQQAIPASGGNMAINTPAAQGRDQMIADQIDLQQLNEMQAHPLYQNFAQSPFGEGDKKYYPAEFFKYLQTQQSAMPQANPLQNNAEYQEFLRLFSNNAGNDFLAGLGPEFAQRLEDPEFIQRVFEDYMRSRAN